MEEVEACEEVVVVMEEEEEEEEGEEEEEINEQCRAEDSLRDAAEYLRRSRRQH